MNGSEHFGQVGFSHNNSLGKDCCRLVRGGGYASRVRYRGDSGAPRRPEAGAPCMSALDNPTEPPPSELWAGWADFRCPTGKPPRPKSASRSVAVLGKPLCDSSNCKSMR